jgi:LPS sulfotransferase NodH
MNDTGNSSALLVATTPRSGSWLLSELLARTGEIGIAQEYFHVNYVAARSRELGLPAAGITATYIAEILRQASDKGVIFSSKLHWLQINQLVDALRLIHPDMVAAGAEAPELIDKSLPGARYVYLTRLDKARQAVSMFRAAYTDVWWQPAHDAAAAEAVVPPDYLAIRWFEEDLARQDAEWLRYFQHFGIEFFAVVYEELVENPASIMAAVFDWLGLEVVERPAGDSSLKRQAGAETERTLLAYRQIRDSLPPCPQGWIWSFERRCFAPVDDGPGSGVDSAPPPTISDLSPF